MNLIAAQALTATNNSEIFLTSNGRQNEKPIEWGRADHFWPWMTPTSVAMTQRGSLPREVIVLNKMFAICE